MKKFAPIVVVLLGLIVLAGCSKPPEMEMSAANSAIDMAKKAEAEVYAPAAYRIAMDTLNAATAAKKEQDGKFSLFRSYTKCKDQFVRAEGLAKKAEADGKAEKARMKEEVSNLLNLAGTEIAAADSALAKAPVGKGNKADIELLKSDLSAIQSSYQDAQADFNTEKYKGAKSKLEVIRKKTQALVAEVELAVAKAGPKRKGK
ncbi:MAG: hypothetical protein V2A61_04985 [Calditrichota bacterium]